VLTAVEPLIVARGNHVTESLNVGEAEALLRLTENPLSRI